MRKGYFCQKGVNLKRFDTSGKRCYHLWSGYLFGEGIYYITNGTEYYAGRCFSDSRLPVWKSHYTRAISFNSIEEAMELAKADQLFYLGVEFICED